MNENHQKDQTVERELGLETKARPIRSSNRPKRFKDFVMAGLAHDGRKRD